MPARGTTPVVVAGLVACAGVAAESRDVGAYIALCRRAGYLCGLRGPGASRARRRV